MDGEQHSAQLGSMPQLDSAVIGTILGILAVRLEDVDDERWQASDWVGKVQLHFHIHSAEKHLQQLFAQWACARAVTEPASSCSSRDCNDIGRCKEVNGGRREAIQHEDLEMGPGRGGAAPTLGEKAPLESARG